MKTNDRKQINGKQNSKLIINLSTELKEKLKRRAEKIGVSLNAYVLFVLAGMKPQNEDE